MCPYRHKVMLEDLEAAVFGVIRSHMDACLDAERLVRKLNAGRQGTERYRLMSRQADRIRERIRWSSTVILMTGSCTNAWCMPMRIRK